MLLVILIHFIFFQTCEKNKSSLERMKNKLPLLPPISVPEIEEMKRFSILFQYRGVAFGSRSYEKHPTNSPNMFDEFILAWALVVENSALLCELVVRFPETANSVLNQQNFRQVVGWALDFLLETKYPNDNDEKLIQFAKYELRLAPRPEGYRNPFSEENVSGGVSMKMVCLIMENKFNFSLLFCSKRQSKISF